MKKENTLNFPAYFLFWLYLIFFVSIIFSFRAISSISIGLILVIGLIQIQGLFSQFFRYRNLSFFLIGCGLLFILQCLALAYTHNVSEGVKLLQRSSGLIVIPFAVATTNRFLAKENYSKVAFYFAAILCAASLYCLVINVLKYFSGAPVSTFFFHDLVKPLSQHAIQFSILVFIGLIFLIEHWKKENFFFNILVPPMVVFLSVFLVLLSSKLIISIFILYVLHLYNKKIHSTKSLFFVSLFIATVTIVLVTPNPVGNRFRGMFTGNSMLFAREKFNPGTYFNGVQFRLLEWRFTYEILNEQHAWLCGLTPGDAQSFLNKKYKETDMYLGLQGTPDHGYLNYHTHNQFLQSLLENGLPALANFIFICLALFKMANSSKRMELKWLAFLLLIYCFTDAPFETQYGIVIFTFFPVFLYLTSDSVVSPNLTFKQSHRTNFFKASRLKQPN
jgi:O-antigen ligase